MQTITVTDIEQELTRLGCDGHTDPIYGLLVETIEDSDAIAIFTGHRAGQYNPALALAILRGINPESVSQHYGNYCYGSRTIWGLLDPAEVD